MIHFFSYQFLKDFTAVPIFILIAADPYIHHSKSLLALFFSLGCLVDTLFSCYSYVYEEPWTIARVKDALGAFGMWTFTLWLAFKEGKQAGPYWQIFFYFATFVDICSVFSILNNRKYTCYTFKLCRKRPS